MYNKEYYTERRQELQGEFKELVNKYANKFLQVHDELNQETDKINFKLQTLNEKEQASILEEQKQAEQKAEEEKVKPKKDESTK